MQTYINDFYWFGSTIQDHINEDNQNKYIIDTPPLIQGKKSTLKEAITKIKNIIDKEGLIHFDGLSCDQKSLNSVLNLAEKNRSSVNHMESEEINNFYSAYQKYGGSFVSFNEIRKRSDLVIFLGSFEELQIRRFVKKVNWDKSKIDNDLFFIGKNNLFSPKNNFKVDDLLNAGNLFLNFLKNSSSPKKFDKLNKKLNFSRFPVVVINPNNGQIFTEHLLKVFAFINNKIRKIRVFRFCGLNNSSGFVNSCVTKTGFPGAISFTDWGVNYNPHDYNAEIQKNCKKTQIFFSNLNLSPKVVNFKENIFIGHPNLKNKEFFDIFVPVKTPGIDSDGLVVRSDGAGVLRLEKKINSNYLEIHQLINQLM